MATICSYIRKENRINHYEVVIVLARNLFPLEAI